MVKLKNWEGGRRGGEWGGKKRGEMFGSTLSNNFLFSLTEVKQTHVLSVPLKNGPSFISKQTLPSRSKAWSSWIDGADTEHLYFSEISPSPFLSWPSPLNKFTISVQRSLLNTQIVKTCCPASSWFCSIIFQQFSNCRPCKIFSAGSKAPAFKYTNNNFTFLNELFKDVLKGSSKLPGAHCPG